MKSRAYAALVAMALNTVVSPLSNAADYRGAAVGWPYYGGGQYAAPAPQSVQYAPAYYAARPVTTASYGGQAAYSGGVAGTAYAPVTAAVANPNYIAAYGAAPASYRMPATTAYYGAAPAGYAAPNVAYYAPRYAPANSYALSPAAGAAVPAEASPYYGQPYPVNYVPPRFAYRTVYSPVPVYSYRPVTAYQPIAGQPTTCMQPTTTTCCQPNRVHSWLSWLNPLNWFNHGSGCGTPACGPAPAPVVMPTVAQCRTSYCAPPACGQPYYPVPANTLPVVPAPTSPVIVTPPTTTIPVVPGPAPGLPRIPSPPTRLPGGSFPSSAVPADTRPSLTPGATIVSPITPAPGTGTIINPAPGATVPSAPSFPVNPSTGGAGSFPSGSNYPPVTDPYRGTSFGRSQASSSTRSQSTPTDGVIRAPELAPPLPPNVTTVPDLDAARPQPPASRAPQLLDPRDKTASADARWAVVPAVWPKRTMTGTVAERQVATTKAFATLATTAAASAAHSAAPSDTRYDDGGWATAAGR